MTAHVLLEHPVADYERWKQAFDADPLHREASGVLGYRVSRRVDEPEVVTVDLAFADVASARAFGAALLDLWRTPMAQAVMRNPTLQLVESVEERTYPAP